MSHLPLSRLRLGLVLSGGGAKGAYQAGVFQAMEERGLRPRVEAVSGCSIGSFNALLFAAGPRRWQQAWEETDFAAFAGEGVSPDSLKQRTARAAASGMEEYLKLPGLLPLEGMKELARQAAEPETLAKGQPRISVCAYQLEGESPRYFWLEGRPFEEAVTLTAASCALPVIFPPVAFEGAHYCDGGVAPPYSAKKNGDKIPLAPLAGLGLDAVLVIYLTQHDRVEPGILPPGVRLLELRPSRPLESAPGTGTLDFSRDSIRRRRELGLEDGRKFFEKVINP